jgi:hypothetical protein
VKTYLQRLGYLLLLVSILSWFALPVISFLSITIREKVAYSSALFIFAEITWWLSIPLLGKEFVEKIKALYAYLKAKLTGNDGSGDD